MASMQASLIWSGTSKSGWPIEKLIGSFIFAARSKTLRMPLESKARVRSARRAMWEQNKSSDVVEQSLRILNHCRHRQGDLFELLRSDLAQPPNESLIVHASQLERIDGRYFHESVSGVRIDPHMPKIGEIVILPIRNRRYELDRQAS